MSAEFLSSATMVASAVIALFFIRYWRETRDRLFLMFAGGFFTFALSRLLLAFLDEEDEGRVLVYMLRLVAFALILAAIVEKNRAIDRPGAGRQRTNPGVVEERRQGTLRPRSPSPSRLALAPFATSGGHVLVGL